MVAANFILQFIHWIHVVVRIWIHMRKRFSWVILRASWVHSTCVILGLIWIIVVISHVVNVVLQIIYLAIIHSASHRARCLIFFKSDVIIVEQEKSLVLGEFTNVSRP